MQRTEWLGDGSKEGERMNNLKIHFLNVGHGDCTIIDFPERLTVVDINNCKKLAKESEDELRTRYRIKYTPNPFFPSTAVGSISTAIKVASSIEQDKARLTDPLAYLRANFPGQPIFRYIQSHPDMDHMAGLSSLVNHERVPIINFWDTEHSIEKDESAAKWQNVNFDVKDWHTYNSLRRSKSDPTVLFLKAGNKGQFYSDDGIWLWAPFDEEKKNDPDADPNAFSYVLLIQFGKCNIVLGGDLPSEKWAQLHRKWSGEFPKIHLLKASHHGRKSGYHMESVKAMNPDITIVWVHRLDRLHM